MFLRWVKWMGLLCWGMGIRSLLQQQHKTQRISIVYGLLLLGVVVTWLDSWLLMKSLGMSMKESWISIGLLCSIVSVSASFAWGFYSSFSNITRTLVIGGFLSAMGIMSYRQMPDAWWIIVLVSTILSFFLQRSSIFRVQSTSIPESNEDLETEIRKGFSLVAKLEGLTVLLLFGVYMPAKHLLQIQVDFGTGIVGWGHGVFVILYVLSLGCTGQTLQWSLLERVIGFFASFVPFGTIWFERWIFVKKVQ